MADLEHCFGCRFSCYVERQQAPSTLTSQSNDSVFLYCSKNHRYISKRALSSPLCFKPEDKNKPVYHCAKKLI